MTFEEWFEKNKSEFANFSPKELRIVKSWTREAWVESVLNYDVDKIRDRVVNELPYISPVQAFVLLGFFTAVIYNQKENEV